MSDSPFHRFTDAEVRAILGLADGPIPDALAAQAGLVPIGTQRTRVLALARARPDVGFIFDALDGAVPKSSIRSYLSVASARGEIGDAWRTRRRRRTARPLRAGARP